MRKSWGFKPRCASDSLQAHGTAALQAPLSMEFSRQEHWRVLSFFPPGHLSDPGIEPKSLMSPALAGRFFTTESPRKPIMMDTFVQTRKCTPPGVN